MRSWTVLGALSLLLLSTSFPIFIASAQEPTRSLGIDELQCMTPDLVVNANQGAKAYFETTVAIYDTDDELGTVELNVTNDMDWPTFVSPNSFNFTKPVAQKVNISVSVPAGTDASEIAVVKLKGYAFFPGETVTSSVSGYLSLKQIFSVSVNYTYIKRGATETWVQINIVNTGNGRDNVLMIILDGDKLDDADIHVTQSQSALYLPKNSSASQKIHCLYEGTVYPKKFDLRISITSMHGAAPQQIIVIPLSFKGPDPPIQPNIFAGVIVAFVIVVVIILAVVLRGPAKRTK
jgi:hypothetical protein